jgi:hypothetical protein
VFNTSKLAFTEKSPKGSSFSKALFVSLIGLGCDLSRAMPRTQQFRGQCLRVVFTTFAFPPPRRAVVMLTPPLLPQSTLVAALLYLALSQLMQKRNSTMFAL